MAALGIYHAAPGSQAWELASPAFQHAEVRAGHGHHGLVIDADRSSRLRRYVQSATLNGDQFERTWLDSAALRSAHLHLVMGALPNRAWGTAPEAAPPSLSSSG
jgi:putative alpha-1,2-mannosidase